MTQCIVIQGRAKEHYGNKNREKLDMIARRGKAFICEMRALLIELSYPKSAYWASAGWWETILHMHHDTRYGGVPGFVALPRVPPMIARSADLDLEFAY